MRISMLVCLLALAWIAAVGAGCKTPCESSANCKRTCQCVDSTTSSRLSCTMAFRCVGKDAVCEEDYDGLTCDDICAQYAAKGECGFERCSISDDCTKKLTCPVKDVNGQPTGLNRDCTLKFSCDIDQQLCDVASTASQTDLCTVCDQQALGG